MLVVAADLAGRKERMWQRIESGSELILSSVGIDLDVSNLKASTTARSRGLAEKERCCHDNGFKHTSSVHVQVLGLNIKHLFVCFDNNKDTDFPL
jgi:hypothetical protein